MPEHHIPYRYTTYTDVLLAVGTAALAKSLYDLPETRIELRAQPDGFYVRHPPSEAVHRTNPFFEVRDKESREVATANVLDRTPFGQKDAKPKWWQTTSVINTLASPVFNNAVAQAYTSEVGVQLLEGTAELKMGGRSQLLYAQASKGVNKAGPSTSQGNLAAEPEQALALLGYQQGGTGFMKDPYTLSLIPRPHEITLAAYRALVEGVLRGYLPKASSGKVMPTREQTVPFFTAMAYFDFVVALFDYRSETDSSRRFGVGKVISGLATYHFQG